ncbi:hypothetical protein EDB83DRAFT_1651546 [Lactarius deliciosus]|nr:hypothetical protein EDB83DRAFT_1651546 [Lactarius deliciosus]
MHPSPSRQVHPPLCPRSPARTGHVNAGHAAPMGRRNEVWHGILRPPHSTPSFTHKQDMRRRTTWGTAHAPPSPGLHAGATCKRGAYTGMRTSAPRTPFAPCPPVRTQGQYANEGMCSNLEQPPPLEDSTLLATLPSCRELWRMSQASSTCSGTRTTS